MNLPITDEQLERWKQGNIMIQDAFPNLSPSQREFILTGITDDEWDATFGGDE